MFHEYKLLTSQNDYIINNLGLSFRFPTKGILPKDSCSVGNLYYRFSFVGVPPFLKGWTIRGAKPWFRQLGFRLFFIIC